MQKFTTKSYSEKYQWFNECAKYARATAASRWYYKDAPSIKARGLDIVGYMHFRANLLQIEAGRAYDNYLANNIKAKDGAFVKAMALLSTCRKSDKDAIKFVELYEERILGTMADQLAVVIIDALDYQCSLNADTDIEYIDRPEDDYQYMDVFFYYFISAASFVNPMPSRVVCKCLELAKVFEFDIYAYVDMQMAYNDLVDKLFRLQ